MEVFNSGGRFEAKLDDRTDLEVLLDKIKGLEHEDVKTKRGISLIFTNISFNSLLKHTSCTLTIFHYTPPPFLSSPAFILIPIRTTRH